MSEKIQNYAGREIEHGRTDDVLQLNYKTEFRYAWSGGIAISRFLEGLKQGTIIGRGCHRCDRILIPPRMFCEECFRPTDEWVPVKDTGHVNTYSISYVAADASRMKTPIIPAVIEIDGASPGMGFLHILGEVEPSRISIGVAVEAVWKPASERIGAITDIQYFRPRKGAGY